LSIESVRHAQSVISFFSIDRHMRMLMMYESLSLQLEGSLRDEQIAICDQPRVIMLKNQMVLSGRAA
jgi:hypothetical protein